MKIYDIVNVPYGLGYDDSKYEEIRRSGYTAGYESGYTDGLASCSGQSYEDMPFTFEALEDMVMVAVPATCYSQKNVQGVDDGIAEPSFHITEQGVKEFVPKIEILEHKGDLLRIWSSSATTKELFTGAFPLYENNVMFQRGTFIVYGNIMSLQYGFDFQGQTELKWPFYTNQAPSQPGSIIGLFYDCTGITDASNLILPATTLVPWSYASMFSGCLNLTGTPELPATTLVERSYSYMFLGAQKVNHIRCLATDVSANRCTTGWLMEVSPTGTFETTSTTNWTTGTSGIPEGWTRVDID